MQLEFGNITIHLLPLIVSAVIIAIIYILSRWSRELTERHYRVYLYFLVSAIIAPIFSYAQVREFYNCGFLSVSLY